MKNITGEPLDNINIHIRTYRSILKSAGVLKISNITASHQNMQSILHENAGKNSCDSSALIYSMLRLPREIIDCEEIILGQSYAVFKSHGFRDKRKWKEVTAFGRRRKMFFDRKNRLTVYITSVTDTDDLVTLLSAYQIEINKLHNFFKTRGNKNLNLFIHPEDQEKITKILGANYLEFLNKIQKKKVDFTVRLLSGSYVEYAKAANHWWNHIDNKLKKLNLTKRPIYFVSSNTHSLVNLAAKYNLSIKGKLKDYLYKQNNKKLISIYESLGNNTQGSEYFLHYLSKKYAKTHRNYKREKEKYEENLGIFSAPAYHYLDIDAQVIEIRKLALSPFVRSMKNAQISSAIPRSSAVIINIDYPLGWGAYLLLTETGKYISRVKGIYIMGKAATLNGQIGDIMLSNQTLDLHTGNAFTFPNAFSLEDFRNYRQGNIFKNQKIVCVKGTFFENSQTLSSWYKNNFTVVEMESGPYLNALYEFTNYNRYPENSNISIIEAPFDIGIAHYASDTPYSKAKNLGIRNLSYEGVEPTYEISWAILKKIILKESESQSSNFN